MSPIEIGGTAPGGYDFGIVTSLPSTARIGDYCSLKVRESESKPWKLWRLQKIEEVSELAWVKIGGPALRLEASIGETASSTYQTFAALEIKAPIRMEADVLIGSSYMQNAVAELNELNITIFINGVESAPSSVVSGSTFQGSPSVRKWRGAIGNGQVAALRFRSASAKLGRFFTGYIEVDPVRVG